MVYFEVSMTYSEIYTKSFSVFKKKKTKKTPDFSDVYCIRVTLMLETNLYDDYHCSGHIFILVTVLSYFSRRLNSLKLDRGTKNILALNFHTSFIDVFADSK